MTTSPSPQKSAPPQFGVAITTIGGPTVLIEYGGLRLLVDPTFDGPGPFPVGTRALQKTHGPALPVSAIGSVDAVLLSHDQHPDNLDRAGREVARSAPRTLTTPVAAARLGFAATGLETWQVASLSPGASRTGMAATAVDVTAVPARHGPDGTEHLTGPVTGFLLTAEDQPTIYVSGDNASLDAVHAIAERFPHVDLAILFAGAARSPLVDGPLTLTGAQAVQAARILDARLVRRAHTDSWAHFSEDGADFDRAFEDAGMASRLLKAAPGHRISL